MVKHEDVDEENAQENFYYNMADTEDSSEVPGREESDDNNGKLNTWAYLTIFSGNFAFLNIRVIYFPEGEFVESNAMRMNAASALTFGPNRSGVKDVQGKEIEIIHRLFLVISMYCQVDVLWCQPIKRIQVVSTSEFHEY
jgi:hypothetical protein